MGRRLPALFFALLWLVAANHCIVGSALAASHNDQQTEHSHCPGHGESSNQNAPPDNGGCDKSGCCQPALERADSSIAFAVSLQAVDLGVPFNDISSLLGADQAYTSQIPFSGHSPPFAQANSLLLSLKLAPNAPPVL